MRIVIISPYRFKAHTKFKQLLNEFTKKYSIIDTEATGETTYIISYTTSTNCD